MGARPRSRARAPRTQQRRQRGDLHGQVDLAGPGGRGGERAQRLLATGGIAVGLGLGDGRLPEQVDGRLDALLPQLGDRGERVLGVLPHDEALGHLLHTGAGDRRDGPCGEPAPGEVAGQASVLGDLRVLQQLVQVARDVLRRRARRAHVDETEQRRPQRGVLDQHVGHPPLHPSRGHGARLRQASGEVGADRADRRLQIQRILGQCSHTGNPRDRPPTVPERFRRGSHPSTATSVAQGAWPFLRQMSRKGPGPFRNAGRRRGAGGAGRGGRRGGRRPW